MGSGVLSAPANPSKKKRGTFVAPPDPQRFKNGEVHGWYNFVLGFSDKLVSQMLDHLGAKPGQVVLDPFCGTGTTLVESMKRGVTAVGVDASPFSCFVSRVKASFADLQPDRLLTALLRVKLEYEGLLRAKFNYASDITYKYLRDSGMVRRGWISEFPLRHAITLKAAILKTAMGAQYRDALLLALVAKVSRDIGNMRFGPEICRARKKRFVNVWMIFERQVFGMMRDLCLKNGHRYSSARVIRGDARYCAGLLRRNGINRVHIAISSPPYPTEHDYTRNTRLELAFLEHVKTNDCLRAIKKRMIRSHTKGVYKTDQDKALVRDETQVEALANRVASRCKEKSYGFARLYPAVIRHYFGGMKRHFRSMWSILPIGGRYAMIVGDQSSYFGVHIPTAKLLGQIAVSCGFEVERSYLWRSRWATKTAKHVREHALILKRTHRRPATKAGSEE